MRDQSNQELSFGVSLLVGINKERNKQTLDKENFKGFEFSFVGEASLLNGDQMSLSASH